MKMIYNVNDKPKFPQLIVFAFQQLLAIMAATIAVPAIFISLYSVDSSLNAITCKDFIYAQTFRSLVYPASIKSLASVLPVSFWGLWVY